MLTTKWLSPTMINNSIKNLDKLINITESAVEQLQIALTWGLIICGANVAIDYIKGFAGFETSEDGECTSVQENMRTTYYVCDRILCPSVPYRCDPFTPSGGADNYIDQANINKKWKDEYLIAEEGGYNEDFETWMKTNPESTNSLEPVKYFI